MEGVEFEALVADIGEHGLREPIMLIGDLILDGRNRYRACQASGINPVFSKFTGEDPAGYVLSLNVHRRHLDESQRAMVATKLANMRSGHRSDIQPAANLPEVRPATPPVSQVGAAKLLNVSARSVRDAGAVVKTGVPELVKAVERGDAAVSAAAAVAKLPPEKQAEIVAQGPAAIKAAKREMMKEVRKAALGENADLPAPAEAKRLATESNTLVLGSDLKYHPPQNAEARQMAIDVDAFGDPLRALDALDLQPSRAAAAMTETDRKVLGPMVTRAVAWLTTLENLLDA